MPPSFICAHCHKEFFAYRLTGGKDRIYCSRACRHEASVQRWTCVCSECGKTFYLPDRRSHTTCSLRCASLRGARIAPQMTTRITYHCHYCKQPFTRYPSWKYQTKYCSLACRRADTKYQCRQCGKKINRVPATVSRVKNVFCSSACSEAYHVGSKHPYWAGGGKAYRGPDWYTQRAKALKRDKHQCQHCGKKGGKLDVHHLVPYRVSHSNDLRNLITLCSPCHKRAEFAWLQANPIEQQRLL